MWTSLYYGNFPYWELNHKVTFDPYNRLILLNGDVDTIDVRVDLYSDWKEWAMLDGNLRFAQAMRVVGGDPIGGGKVTGSTFFLTNGWRILVDRSVNIVGNLYSDDYDSPFHYDSLAKIAISTVSTLVEVATPNIEGISIPTAEEIAQAIIDAGGTGPSAPEVATAVWAAPRATNNDPGSHGEALNQVRANTENVIDKLYLSADSVLDVVQLLLKMEAGRTRIDPDTFTMTVYDEDCVTPLRTFKLLDADGIPSVTNVCERKPIAKGPSDSTSITDVCP